MANNETTAMSYQQAYEAMEEVVTEMRGMTGKDLDQVVPLLRKFHAARSVVLQRIEQIQKDPLLQEALQAAPPSKGSPNSLGEEDDRPF